MSDGPNICAFCGKALPHTTAQCKANAQAKASGRQNDGLRFTFTSADLVDCYTHLADQHGSEIVDFEREIKEFGLKSLDQVAELAGLPDSDDGYHEPQQRRVPSPEVVKVQTLKGMQRKLQFMRYAHERSKLLAKHIPPGETFRLTLAEVSSVMFGVILHIEAKQGFRQVLDEGGQS